MKMNREQARQFMREHATDHLTPAENGKSYICPICKSGDGPDHSGITTRDGIHFTCWAKKNPACKIENSDIIDIIAMENGIPENDHRAKFEAAAQAFGIEITDRPAPKPQSLPKQQPPHQQQPQQPEQPVEENEPTAEDFREFFDEANKHLSDTDYHRSISTETLNRFNIGFVKQWRHPKAPATTPYSPRLIIPTGETSYLARDTRKDIPEAAKKYSKSKVGHTQIFNLQALNKKAMQPVFVVEGEIDALSIIDTGAAEAIALGSVAMANKLIETLKKKKPTETPPLILALDNDTAGATAQERLGEALRELSIPFFEKNCNAEFKDPNEFLTADRERFTVAVKSILTEVTEEFKEEHSIAKDLTNFWQIIEQSKTAAFYPTGFESLDSVLDGGLYSGLYFIGAVSALGKTTFALQIADNIAKQGHPVIYISLEVSKRELMAKSISRITYETNLKYTNGKEYAKTTRDILNGRKYDLYSPEEKQLILHSVNEYGKYAKNLFILDGVGNIGVEGKGGIRETVEAYIKIGLKPVVIIDYLQILKPTDIRATDKQNTDRAVTNLKRLSRDYGITVIGISSFNRDSYYEPVTYSSFKESGAIEYSSDCLMALQFDGLDYQDKESKDKRAARLRDLKQTVNECKKHAEPMGIQLKVLKNRNGLTSDNLKLNLVTNFNYYQDKTENWRRIV